jgi:hypothetical protein
VKPTGLLISRYVFRPAPFPVRSVSTTSLESTAASLVEVVLKPFLRYQSLWRPDQHLQNVGVHVEWVKGLAKEPCETHVAESPESRSSGSLARARVQITLHCSNRLEASHGARLSTFKAWYSIRLLSANFSSSAGSRPEIAFAQSPSDVRRYSNKHKILSSATLNHHRRLP